MRAGVNRLKARDVGRPQAKVLSSEMSRLLGAIRRAERAGPELDLVASFLKTSILPTPPRCDIAIFQEPKLPSGFPDLVVVFWRRDIVRSWATSRAELQTDDIRLAHYLSQVGPVSLLELQETFGKKAQRSAERLLAAGVLKTKRDKWILGALDEIFAVKQLIAIEAKVSEWRAGLKQAWLNTWFASDSYLLIPRIPRGGAVLDCARELGIGVCTDRSRVMKPTCRPPLPASYGSWLFNEWVGRIPAAAGRDGKWAEC